MREGTVTVDALMRRGMQMDESATRSQDAMQPLSHPSPIHPMEGLRQGRHPDRAGVGRQVFGPKLKPVDIGETGPGGAPGTLGQHVAISIKAGGPFEVRREQEQQRSRPAAHVEQPAPAIERKRLDQAGDQLVRIGDAALRVVAGAARVQRRVPLPGILSHQAIIADEPSPEDLAWRRWLQRLSRFAGSLAPAGT